MKKLILLPLFALFGATLVRAEPTRAELVTRIESCEAILQEVQMRPSTAIPASVWQRARAIVILNQFKAGFLIGVQNGYGVAMAKRTNGLWSVPVLINAGEASLGLQLGAKSVTGVYIITDDLTTRLLYKQRFNLGIDAKAVIGPKAAEAERNNEEILRTPMLAYIKSVGLYAGVTVKTGHVSRDDKANFVLYNTRYTMPELLFSDWVPPPSEVQPLMTLVQRLAP